MDLLLALLVLAIVVQWLDLAHMMWCDRRAERRFRASLAPRRTAGEAAAGEVA